MKKSKLRETLKGRAELDEKITSCRENKNSPQKKGKKTIKAVNGI